MGDSRAPRHAATAEAPPAFPGKLNFGQVQSWNCALCKRWLNKSRSLGEFAIVEGLAAGETLELWACSPVCRQVTPLAREVARLQRG